MQNDSYTYTRRHFCSSQNEKIKILKIVTDSCGVLVLNSKAAAQRWLKSDRNPNQKDEIYLGHIGSLYTIKHAEK